MQKTIFEFSDYKAYLHERLAGKGEKLALARALGCQSSFLSQVLRGKPHLSLEQSVLVADHLGFSEDEAKHFLLLLLKGRAGSKRLRDYFQKELNQSTQSQQKISSRLTAAKQLNKAALGIYYSDWGYGAVHVLCSIPTKSQIEFLCSKTGLARSQVQSILNFLETYGLVETVNGHFKPTDKRIHLPDTDPLIASHHRNYRLRAIEQSRSGRERDLHYSMLTAISREDGEKIHQMILELVQKTDHLIRPSPEEAAFQLTLDFFEL